MQRTVFRANVNARLLAIRQRNVTCKGTAATIATTRMLLAIRYYRRTLQTLAERDTRRALAELGSKWYLSNLRDRQAAGKPVTIFGRLVTSPL
jgi:hypothetical protein